MIKYLSTLPVLSQCVCVCVCVRERYIEGGGEVAHTPDQTLRYGDEVWQTDLINTGQSIEALLAPSPPKHNKINTLTPL